jgi:hypothetical protein
MPTEYVKPFRRRTVETEAKSLRERIVEALQGVGSASLPPDLDALGIRDRDADVWESLIAVADLLDPRWGKSAREAALAFVSGREPALTRGTRLLLDIRDVFDRLGVQQVTTNELIRHLCLPEDSPWGSDGGMPQLGAKGLARHLKPYGIGPVQMRRAGQPNARGYRRSDFADTWNRYLPLTPL